MIPFFDDKPSWLLECRSKTWFENTIEPTLTPYGSVMIVFAWKAEHWPIPAIEITNTLEKEKFNEKIIHVDHFLLYILCFCYTA